MGETFYIFKDGDLRRKDDSIVITSIEGQKKNLKAEVTDEIYLFGEVSTNTKLLNFISQKKIIIHIFNYYGFYSGSFYPREINVSGYLLVEQVKCYDDSKKRITVAREILRAASYNIYRNLRYYNGRGVELSEPMKNIQSLQKNQLLQKEFFEHL